MLLRVRVAQVLAVRWRRWCSGSGGMRQCDVLGGQQVAMDWPVVAVYVNALLPSVSVLEAQAINLK